MLLLGMFYSSDKPVMNMYLRPIVDDLIFLFHKGTNRHLCRHVQVYVAITTMGIHVDSLYRGCCQHTSW